MPGFRWRFKALGCLVAAALLSGCSLTAPGGPGQELTPPVGTGWFGGYLDVTVLPGLRVAEAPAPGASTSVLSFITSDPGRPCEPAWGGFYDLDRASDKLGLDAQVEAFRTAGNKIAVSFGGQRGTELAAACSDPGALVRAYASVIGRYGLDTIDLDVEGPHASDHGVAERRAAAIARLQAERTPAEPLKVWLTVPVSRKGLTSAAVVSVETMLAAGVELSGVNIMTMNFGPLAPGSSMAETAAGAAEATHRTLAELYGKAGKPLGEPEIWNRIGLTPMIGVNDVEGNIFTLQDAEELNRFAVERAVGRVSLWSLNRDAACTVDGQGQAHGSLASNCSGVEQEPGMFAKVLGNSMTHHP